MSFADYLESRWDHLLELGLEHFIVVAVAVAGMRVSTVLTVGIAAIGAYVNGPGLGDDIFRGAVIHTRIPKSQPGVFGEVFATDGEIVANKLDVIQDDKQAIVKYNVAMTVRQDVYGKHKAALAEEFLQEHHLIT